jgi:hypothetical protein
MIGLHHKRRWQRVKNFGREHARSCKERDQVFLTDRIPHVFTYEQFVSKISESWIRVKAAPENLFIERYWVPETGEPAYFHSIEQAQE